MWFEIKRDNEDDDERGEAEKTFPPDYKLRRASERWKNVFCVMWIVQNDGGYEMKINVCFAFIFRLQPLFSKLGWRMEKIV